MTIKEIINLFEIEFKEVRDKFEVIKLLDNKRKFDYKEIEFVKLPSNDNNIVWHPGVYVFFGNEKPYRVGRHLANSRARVLQHINADTNNGNNFISDLSKYNDSEIILFNVIDRKDYHWVAALEIYLERVLKKELQIPAKRQG